MKVIEKQAFLNDYKGNEQQAIIRINDGIFVGIDTFNQNNDPTGYIRIYFHPNNRLFLDVIYCYDEFLGAGIATLISDLADYVLSGYSGYVIRGAYDPKQLSTDRENQIERSERELDIRAREFYAGAGYEIVEYESYLNNKDKYPYLVKEDFYCGEGGPTAIVAKEIVSKEHSFLEDNGIIYHTNYDKSKGKSM